MIARAPGATPADADDASAIARTAGTAHRSTARITASSGSDAEEPAGTPRTTRVFGRARGGVERGGSGLQVEQPDRDENGDQHRDDGLAGDETRRGWRQVPLGGGTIDQLPDLGQY